MPTATPARHAASAPGPFDLTTEVAYRPWREHKLRQRANDAHELLVELRDPRQLSAAERSLLLQRIARHGVALYRSPRTEDDPALPRALGAQLGLVRLDANWLADEDGLSRIAVAAGAAAAGESGEGGASGASGASGARGEFIPYTDRAIGWHTDGYYHPEARRILAMILHCVRPAAAGGETTLLDHELVYIALRDASPALVQALMHPQAMTIPAREDESGVARAAQSGPVFSIVPGPAGTRLHMRYTARTRSIEWRDDAPTREAAAALARCMDTGSKTALAGILRLTLQPGMGLVGHNVLHARSAFRDDPGAPRLLYRARYLDGVHGVEDARGDEGVRAGAREPAAAAATAISTGSTWPTG